MFGHNNLFQNPWKPLKTPENYNTVENLGGISAGTEEFLGGISAGTDKFLCEYLSHCFIIKGIV